MNSKNKKPTLGGPGKWPRECKEYGKLFKASNNMRRHIREVHIGRKRTKGSTRTNCDRDCDKAGPSGQPKPICDSACDMEAAGKNLEAILEREGIGEVQLPSPSSSSSEEEVDLKDRGRTFGDFLDTTSQRGRLSPRPA